MVGCYIGKMLFQRINMASSTQSRILCQYCQDKQYDQDLSILNLHKYGFQSGNNLVFEDLTWKPSFNHNLPRFKPCLDVVKVNILTHFHKD